MSAGPCFSRSELSISYLECLIVKEVFFFLIGKIEVYIKMGAPKERPKHTGSIH